MEATRNPFDAIVVTTQSPDGQIAMRYTHPRQIGVRFRPGAYDRYTRRELESQLVQVATKLWVAYRRACQAALTEILGFPSSGGPEGDDEKSLRFERERAVMPAVGESANGEIRVRTTGFVRWDVQISNRALDRLAEGQFCEALAQAAQGLLDDHMTKLHALKNEIFDLRLPDRNARSRGTRGW